MTLSTYQKNTWGDFLEMLVPQALQVAFEEDPEFRQGLPLNYLNYSGVANSDTVTKERSDFLRRVEKLMTKLISHAPVDAAADQMAVRMLQDALPPVLTEAERSHSVYGSGASWEDGKIVNMMTITGDTDVRLIRRGVARLVSEADCVCIYHTMENSRVYHEVQPERVEFETEAGPSIECILNAFPNFVKVKDLPHDNLEFKVDMVTMLYEKGVLVTKE
ncbi:predicted protein [Nematostella vectensis]|uniref:Bifunctional lysine-specific demethylase and histidyl-hydroxylase n=1 Tax=Nematostella vectensis TaxID=45351 RepID=A7SAW1_NEMVE|nr:predicted protein [Nematostella vectensis]|eukprot:XP_001631181.1 predicted protein [Nematostella vectensis]